MSLKIPPEEVLDAIGKRWEVVIDKDARIPALVSLIKAAHLTLFEMLGYRYALSAGGCFVGYQILGEFFRQNKEKPKIEVLEDATHFFREFVHLVRPIEKTGLELRGTITDKQLWLCGWNSGSPWAFIVFIKTSQQLHAVMIPILERAESVAKFTSFIQNEGETLDVTMCRFDKDHWKISKQSAELRWPKNESTRL